MFDESLERVIIVDDNPMRIVQHHRQRLVKKFQADPYLAARQAGATAKDSPLIALFDQTLLTVAAEVEESVGYLQQHPGTRSPARICPTPCWGRSRLGPRALGCAWKTAASTSATTPATSIRPSRHCFVQRYLLPV